MPRFFVLKENIREDKIFIFGEDAFHIARSLRMAVGDNITVSDGSGRDYECRLTLIRDDTCECEIISDKSSEVESPVRITLFMAYPKGDKLELVIQKAVELGAVRIVPFESSRCIKRPKADKVEKQTARLGRIAEEAAKQCGRALIPKVSEPVDYKTMLSLAAECDLPIFCYEAEQDCSLKRVLDAHADAKSIAVVVGSEGGFSQSEAKDAQAAGLIPTSLGKRILRCETAPIYTLSAISYKFEL